MNSLHKRKEQGCAEGPCNLDCCYCFPQNLAEAVKWYRMSPEQGDADVQYSLGNCYLEGKGIPPDHEEAVRFFLNAVEQGHAGAQCALGNCYAVGDGVPQDHTEEYMWFHTSVAYRNGEALESCKIAANKLSTQTIKQAQTRGKKLHA